MIFFTKKPLQYSLAYTQTAVPTEKRRYKAKENKGSQNIVS